MLPEYIVAIAAAVIVPLLMMIVFKMIGSSGTPQPPSKAPVAKTVQSQKQKKKELAVKREAAREEAELKALLDREIARNPGMSSDTKKAQPKELIPVTQRRVATQHKATPPPKQNEQTERKETKPQDKGFKSVSAPMKTQKKEKIRAPTHEFQEDEEMERKLAAFFSRSDRRNRASFTNASTAVLAEPSVKESYVLIKGEFSSDTKWGTAY